jgi:hypothetical protein
MTARIPRPSRDIADPVAGRRAGRRSRADALAAAPASPRPRPGPRPRPQPENCTVQFSGLSDEKVPERPGLGLPRRLVYVIDTKNRSVRGRWSCGFLVARGAPGGSRPNRSVRSPTHADRPVRHLDAPGHEGAVRDLAATGRKIARCPADQCRRVRSCGWRRPPWGWRDARCGRVTAGAPSCRGRSGCRGRPGAGPRRRVERATGSGPAPRGARRQRWRRARG